MKAHEFVQEINAPDELTIPEELYQRFTSAGWQIVGEGRDQIVLARPGSRSVLKIVGSGSAARQQAVENYVKFFRQHQRNPHFPRIFSEKTLTWQGKKYYAYTQEMLNSLPSDEAVLDYLEYAMGELEHDQEPDFSKIPPGLTEQQIEGLIYAVDELYGSGQEPSGFDLSNVANIMVRPGTGQLVLVDPYSDFAELDESQDPAAQRTAQELVRELEADYDCIMVDARGHGWSAAPESGYTNAEHAADYAALIERLGLEKPALIGHSMGGGVAQIVSLVDPGLKGAVLYGSMSGDERRNLERIRYWSGGSRGQELFALSPEVLRQASAWTYLAELSVPYSVHHGTQDAQVPPEWSWELCRRLKALTPSAPVTGAPHARVTVPCQALSLSPWMP